MTENITDVHENNYQSGELKWEKANASGEKKI